MPPVVAIDPFSVIPPVMLVASPEVLELKSTKAPFVVSVTGAAAASTILPPALTVKLDG